MNPRPRHRAKRGRRVTRRVTGRARRPYPAASSQPTPPRQMAEAASSPSPNDSSCEEQAAAWGRGGSGGRSHFPSCTGGVPAARNPASGFLNHQRERGGEAGPERSPGEKKASPPHTHCQRAEEPDQPALGPQLPRPAASTAG